MNYDDWKSTDPADLEPLSHDEDDEPGETEPLAKYDAFHSHRLVTQLGEAMLANEKARFAGSLAAYKLAADRLDEAKSELAAWALEVVK